MANNLNSNVTRKVARVFLDAFEASRVVSKTVDTYATTLAHTYTGEHVDLDATTYARKVMPGVHTFDLHHTVYFDASTSISASIRNITDESYESPDGYAQAGRDFVITYSVKF